jgi:hypothetical protein
LKTVRKCYKLSCDSYLVNYQGVNDDKWYDEPGVKWPLGLYPGLFPNAHHNIHYHWHHRYQ